MQTGIGEPRLGIEGSVGRYQLRARLGQGGFGEVFEAWDAQLQRSVALKRLRGPAGLIGAERLMAEARLAASLRHRAFVHIYTLEEQDAVQSIVMELVQGDTVRASADARPLAAASALDIVGQVAAAMAEAHASGLVHGDLKPSNLMLEPGGQVRILDFGLARQIDPLATQSLQPGDQEGTIAYMAPERLQGAAPDQASDIYALGIILYELLTGARPFASLRGQALALAQLHSSSEQWPFPAAMPMPLRALVLAMTAREPARRLPDMRAVQAAIGGLAGAPPGPPLPPLLAARRGAAPRGWLRRARLPLAMAAGALLCAAAVLLWLPADWRTRDWAPYSEARAMQAGLDGLRRSDRDGALEAALAQFERVLEHQPRHAGAAAGASIAHSLRYIGDGRDEAWRIKAEASAQLALQEDEQLALAHAARAWAAALRGDTGAALAAAQRALALDPGELFALQIKISVLQRLQRYDEAGQTIAEALARHPRERLFSDLLGTQAFQRGQYAEAERAFRSSLAQEPDAVFAYANLSAALLRQDRSDEALQVLQQGLQVRASGILYSNLGTTLFARGDYVGAAAAYQRAVSAARGGPNDFLRWANLADALRWIPGRQQASRQAYRRAVDLLAPMLERRKDDAAFLSRMGLYVAHLESPRAALDWVARAVAAAPDSPDVRFRAAVASELAGARAAAIGHLLRARELGYPARLIETEPDLVALRRDPHTTAVPPSTKETTP
ncbi:protein kinase domain-containing protein [Duganella violaceipulchra]|uniref:Protein kinase n=1 Tax=Duganella violaceipulchra TaxID=2849652 RepID=A0AA41H616_9BURK|nr:serine/threonine-protein kinase [Duganella violaceicalia]MBV6320925.1 protein kinase [Duganella violaceicalia]MCP2008363.1 serine/threonine-protein kinase [Duganella violaceicalia]